MNSIMGWVMPDITCTNWLASCYKIGGLQSADRQVRSMVQTESSDERRLVSDIQDRTHQFLWSGTPERDHNFIVGEISHKVQSILVHFYQEKTSQAKHLLPYAHQKSPRGLLSDLRMPRAVPLLVLLTTPLPKYSAITENPSFEFFTCWKNRSWSLPFCSKLLFVSKTDLYSDTHSGHSFSLSPRQRWWNECIHMKWTAGRSSVKVQAVHLLSWKILALVLRSCISFLIAAVSSCRIVSYYL